VTRPSLRAAALAIAVAAVAGGGCAAAGGRPERAAGAGAARIQPPTAPRSHPSTFFNPTSFAQARLRAGPPNPVPGAKAVIVPHHWVAGHLIIGGIRDLVAGSGATRVIVVGPNHIAAGGALVTTSDQAWSTPLGRVDADAGAARRLAGARVATLSPGALTHEHSMAGMMPALADAAPGVRVVPLAIRPGLRLPEARRLAGALGPLLADPKTVLVVSVDFSHYHSADVARRNDLESIALLRDLDAVSAIGLSDEHFDSPGSIATLLEAMRAAGATRFVLRANTNSAEILGPTPAGTTSYVSGFFVPPQGAPTPAAATVAQNEADPAGARRTR
jgi:AmmeMemoRadiSam system protein B